MDLMFEMSKDKDKPLDSMSYSSASFFFSDHSKPHYLKEESRKPLHVTQITGGFHSIGQAHLPGNSEMYSCFMFTGLHILDIVYFVGICNALKISPTEYS
jgi:hypothetical protein